MQQRDITAPLKRKAEAFITIDGEDFFVEDWLQKTRPGNNRPLVIVNVFEDSGDRFVVIRDETFERLMMPLREFTEKVRKQEFVRIDKPKYKVGQRMKNRFTERFLQIIEVPFAPNEKDDAYVYFVLEYTPISGRNFKAVTEQELDDLYKKEGVELC